jgi:DNA helicase-2/ATP-dependent DNA helicase PcrA
MKTYQKIQEEKFREEYNKLNEAQRKAVDTIEGPVMVIAGPGTGKTQILAARIGKILLDTDTLPENILCLTYTDAGAIAMRRRLQYFIGADAFKVHIYTFHAFCNDVIQDNLGLFEKNALEPVSELETVQILKELIDRFPKNNPLKRYRGDIYYEINNLHALFSNMKREGWTPQFLLNGIEAYKNELPEKEEFRYKRNYKQFKAGDINPVKLAEEMEKMEKLEAAVKEFDNYQELLRKRDRYDFNDMINWVIRVFEEQPNVLAKYQEQFQYILVDEFQDTSGTQNKIVELLINYWEEPNIFVVGDDDQSIFRFQGANIENMKNFADAYSHALRTIILTNNYRSTQPILDISKASIEKNNERLVNSLPRLSKDLVSANSSINHLLHTPEIFVCKTPDEEMIWITQSVKKLLEQGTAPENIAVIYRENKFGEQLSEYFRLENISFFSKRDIDILKHPFIQKTLNILRYLNAEHDIPYGGDEMLFEILHYDFYKIPPIDIARLTVEVNELKYKGKQVSIRSLLAEKTAAAPKDLFDNGLNPTLKQTGEALESLIADVPNVTLQQLFENVIHKGGILTYIMNSPDKIELMQMLSAFFDFIKAETARNHLLNLGQLISNIDLMIKEGITLPFSKVAGSDKNVNLLTAHGSKGLEFKHVFFAGLNNIYWEKKRKPSGGFKIPDTIIKTAAAEDNTEELRRLFYVALTRAEQFLYLSYAAYKNDGKQIEQTRFLAEINEQYELPTHEVTLNEEEIFRFKHLQFEAKAPEIEKTEEAFITQLLSKFSMNVTALNAYLDCPLGFYYKNLIRIPSGKNEATEFGSAVHYAVEKLFAKMQNDPEKKFPPADEMIRDFSWYIQKHRENFTAEAFKRREEYGKQVLKDYYDKYVQQWNKVVVVEKNVRNVVVNDIPLKGKLDKLEFNGKEVNVVDYKTGDVDRAQSKLVRPNDKNP